MAFTVNDIVEKDGRIDIDLHRGQIGGLIANREHESAAQLLTAFTDFIRPPSGPPLAWVFDEASDMLLGEKAKWTADHHTVMNLAADKLGIPQP